MARFELVFGDAVGHWVAQHTGGHYANGGGQALGLQRNGELHAGCLFENFNGRSMVAHLAIRGRITPAFLWYLADYAFRQHRIHKLIAPVASENHAMMRLAAKLGFIAETSIRDASPEGDLVLWTMTRQQCRFLEDRYGKTHPARTA